MKGRSSLLANDEGSLARRDDGAAVERALAAVKKLASLVLMPDGNWRGQIVRYAISGGMLVLFYSSIYWSSAVLLEIPALIANTMAFLATLMLGWAIHSRWSFGGYGRRDRPAIAYSRFLLVNLAGYALNSFWVWLIVERLEASVTASLLPIVFVTPWLSFWANRRWTFS